MFLFDLKKLCCHDPQVMAIQSLFWAVWVLGTTEEVVECCVIVSKKSFLLIILGWFPMQHVQNGVYGTLSPHLWDRYGILFFRVQLWCAIPSRNLQQTYEFPKQIATSRLGSGVVSSATLRICQEFSRIAELFAVWKTLLMYSQVPDILIGYIGIYILYIYILYIYGPVSRVPTPPPNGMGGGLMPLWWCIYIHTYLHTYLPTYIPTYIHTYIPLHYITLPYITLPYLTLPYLTFHTYIHTITLHYITLPYITLPYLTFHTYIHT